MLAMAGVNLQQATASSKKWQDCIFLALYFFLFCILHFWQFAFPPPLWLQWHGQLFFHTTLDLEQNKLAKASNRAACHPNVCYQRACTVHAVANTHREWHQWQSAATVCSSLHACLRMLDCLTLCSYRYTRHMLMQTNMPCAREDTHVICSCRYTCHMLIQIHVSYAHETHMSYAHAGTHVICSCGYTSHMLTKIHMSAAYLLGCSMLCSSRYTSQLLTCWAA